MNDSRSCRQEASHREGPVSDARLDVLVTVKGQEGVDGIGGEYTVISTAHYCKLHTDITDVQPLPAESSLHFL